MKKVISVMIAVLMVIALLPLNVFAEGDDLEIAKASYISSLNEGYDNLTTEQKAEFIQKVKDAADADALEAVMMEAQKLNREQGTDEYKKEQEEKAKLPAAQTRLQTAIDFVKSQRDRITSDKIFKDADFNLIKKLNEVIKEAESWVNSDKLTVEKAEELIKKLNDAFDELTSSMGKQPEVKPEPKPEPKPQPKPDTKPSDKNYPYYRGYRYGYYRPASLEYTMDKAKAFKNSYPTQIANASYAARTEFNSAYSDVADMYNNEYWGYYGYYDGYYYGDRVYYRNGNWYNYDEYVRRYGTYDMENYRRYGYYGDYYDGYYEDLYERNGKVYSYSDYYRTFGRYPYESERLEYRDGYGYWDPYYGWTYDGYYNGYYDYYGSNYRARLERLIDAIRAIAREYPTNSSIYINYSGLAYPSYSNDYYYGYYDYYGYNGLTSSQVKNMRDLISKAEKVRGEVKGNVDKQIVNNLQAAIDDGYRALRGRSSYSTAYNNLEAAINAADLVDNTIYIRSAYMQGTSNGNFGPNEQLTRAQVAQIVANLLRQSGKTTVYNPKQYKDVEDYRWYKGAVDLVTSYGIMEGTPAGNFEPNRLVTKAELVVTAARLKNYQTTPGNVFGLTSHYWAQGYIQTAYVNGWLDTKNGFVPNAPITRAETVHIFNGALGYGPDQDYIIKYANQMNKFNDVTRGMDYYFDIITATNSISYKVKLNGNRVWLTHMQPNGIWAMPQYSAGGVAVNPLN